VIPLNSVIEPCILNQYRTFKFINAVQWRNTRFF